MKRFHWIQLMFFLGMLSLMTTFDAVAAPKSSISGKVIDAAGKPVADMPIVLVALNMEDRITPQIGPQMKPPILTQTDKIGAFSIKDIEPAIYGLSHTPHRVESEYELVNFKIAGIGFHIDSYYLYRFRGYPIYITPGSELKDVELKVQLRMVIRGQVLTQEGNPLRNTKVNLMLRTRNGFSGGTEDLDNEGRFVRYVNNPGTFTVDVKHGRQSAKSKPIRLQYRQRIDGLILKLKNDISAEQHVVKLNEQARHDAIKRNLFEMRSQGAWVTDPENRQAYKRIRCRTVAEAQEIAKAQGAYLVAINDEAEQQWILNVFGARNAWIGLKAGETHWDKGEPVTYTNWKTPPERNKDKDNEAYIVFREKTGVWEVAASQETEYAILEKDDLVIGVPESTENKEKR